MKRFRLAAHDSRDTPTMLLNGRCMAQNNTVPCHYWLLLSDNKDPNVAGTADVISVLVVDKTGKRLHGTQVRPSLARMDERDA